MTGIWLLSYLILWAIVLGLIVVCVALARQIGLIHRRILPFPAKGTPEGPDVGELLPPVEADAGDPNGGIVGGVSSRPRLYVFVGANCSACDDLAPSLRSVFRSDRKDLDLVLVSVGGSAEDNHRFVKRNRLADLPYVIAPDVIPKYGIAGTPFAVVVDEAGVVRSKGVANHLEHLESLIASAGRLQDLGSRGRSAPV